MLRPLLLPFLDAPDVINHRTGGATLAQTRLAAGQTGILMRPQMCIQFQKEVGYTAGSSRRTPEVPSGYIALDITFNTVKILRNFLVKRKAFS